MSDLNLLDLNLRIALLKAVADDISERMTNERAAHRDALVEKYHDEGTKSFDVKLPDGTKVGAVTLSIPKPTTEVTDDKVLLEWAKANAPELVTERVVPGQPAQFIPATDGYVEEVLDRTAVADLVKRLKAVDKKAGGPVVDPDTGMVVEGVTYTPGATPKSFSVKYEDDGREAIGRALRAGDLAHLIEGTPLAALPASQG